MLTIQDYSCTKHFVYIDHYSNCYLHYIKKLPTEQGQKSNLGKPHNNLRHWNLGCAIPYKIEQQSIWNLLHLKKISIVILSPTRCWLFKHTTVQWHFVNLDILTALYYIEILPTVLRQKSNLGKLYNKLKHYNLSCASPLECCATIYMEFYHMCAATY
jgi:hypothetical protein